MIYHDHLVTFNNKYIPKIIYCLQLSGGQGYRCTCTAAYTGPRCETYVPCSSAPCLHGGSCSNVGETYRCNYNYVTQCTISASELSVCANTRPLARGDLILPVDQLISNLPGLVT